MGEGVALVEFVGGRIGIARVGSWRTAGVSAAWLAAAAEGAVVRAKGVGSVDGDLFLYVCGLLSVFFGDGKTGEAVHGRRGGAGDQVVRGVGAGMRMGSAVGAVDNVGVKVVRGCLVAVSEEGSPWRRLRRDG